MFPAPSNAYRVWLHRLRPIFVLRQWFARRAAQAVFVCLLSTLGYTLFSVTALSAETPGALPDLENPASSLSNPNLVSEATGLQTETPSIDLASPVQYDEPLDRWFPWIQPARKKSWLADEPDDPAKPISEPDITEPGPDMGDYPNSAYTLPQGRIYVEFAPLTLQTADRFNSASYNFPFLLRYGITDDVELRLISSGLASVFDPGNTVSGFTPLIIDTKIHLWDDQIERFIPAASLEVYVQTTLGTPTFQGGVEPSINLNLDFPVTKKTNIEMTFGYTGVQDSLFVFTGERFISRFSHEVPIVHRANLNVNQFSYQWAVEQQITDDLQVFVHGYFNGPVYLQSGPGKVIGAGWFYKVSQQIMLFSSYNFGLDSSSPPFSTQLGMAFAL
ncbi:MAG: hypothetical protein JWN70_1342 [Planctomycetaceae bacterium]|nr:hypothetical protein [Planctomycetaceae bacterium]